MAKEIGLKLFVKVSTIEREREGERQRAESDEVG